MRDSSHRAAPVPHADRHAGAIRRARGNEAAANFIRQAKCPYGGRRSIYPAGIRGDNSYPLALRNGHAGLGARAAPSSRRQIAAGISGLTARRMKLNIQRYPPGSGGYILFGVLEHETETI